MRQRKGGSKDQKTCSCLNVEQILAVCVNAGESDFEEALLICRVEELTEEIARRVEAGEKVYVHCWGGRGRAGTIGACLLHRLYGLDADEALERVQRAFITRGDGSAPLATLSLREVPFGINFYSCLQNPLNHQGSSHK